MSTAGRNRSLLAGITGGALAPVNDTPTPPAAGAQAQPEPAGRLSTRMSGIARVTSGENKEITLKLVDPARCRMWTRHNRRYDLLNPDNCADLLEGLRSQGRQEFPAVVRRVQGDPDIDYEVIAGARRHWAVSYLRTVEHRDLKYLVEERDLTDEAAFRLSDIENRSRTDLSDYERALDYLQALVLFYDDNAKRMAGRLEVSESWLSRFLNLARLPKPVIAAFGSVQAVKVAHARQIKPFLEGGPVTDLVLEEAVRLAEEQAALIRTAQSLIEATQVVQRLQKAGGSQKPVKAAKTKAPPPAAPTLVKNQKGDRLFALRKKGRKMLLLEVSLDSKGTEDEMVEAFRSALLTARG